MQSTQEAHRTAGGTAMRGWSCGENLALAYVRHVGEQESQHVVSCKADCVLDCCGQQCQQHRPAMSTTDPDAAEGMATGMAGMHACRQVWLCLT